MDSRFRLDFLFPGLGCFQQQALYGCKRATSNSIYYRSMDTSGVWSGWSSLPGSTSDSPVLVRFEDKLFLFVKGATSNSIHYQYLSSDSGTWSGWITRMGSGTSHAPAAAVYDGKIFLFQKGTSSGKIYYATTGDTSGTYWYPWSEVPGGGTTSTSPNAAVIPQTGRLSVAIRGNSGAIYAQAYDILDSWPGVWGQIPGSTTDTPVQRTQYFWNPWETEYSQHDDSLANTDGIAEDEASGQ